MLAWRSCWRTMPPYSDRRDEIARLRQYKRVQRSYARAISSNPQHADAWLLLWCSGGCQILARQAQGLHTPIQGGAMDSQQAGCPGKVTGSVAIGLHQAFGGEFRWGWWWC